MIVKKIIVALAALMIFATLATASAKEAENLNIFGHNTVPCTNIYGFEEKYDGYETGIDYFDGKLVRVINRNGSDETATGFNMYSWELIKDSLGNFVPVETANYIVVDYYYHSPDETPALVGNRMGWVQGKVVPRDNLSKKLAFAWNTKVMSTPMVANKWDKLVISLKDDKTAFATLEKYRKKGAHFLHQFKFYPLERDMGKNDVLYIGDVTFQSWDPREKMPDAERKLTFLTCGKDESFVILAKDLEYVTLPEYKGELPQNARLSGWENSYDGRIYHPGESYRLLAGCDVSFVPKLRYSFDFSALDGAYINGYEDGSFRPQNSITRAEACKIIASLINPESKAFSSASFSDVLPDAWYYNSVATLDNIGAFENVWKGTLNPNEPITRAEFIQLVYSVCDGKGQNEKYTVVSDLIPADFCYDAVMYAMNEGIITGYEDGSFKPLNKITRAEAVTIINRLIGRVFNENALAAQKFSDIEGHWAKGQIIASASKTSDGNFEKNNTKKEYVLSGSSAKDYIPALYEQSDVLCADAIRRGIDAVSEQMKKDILSTGNTEEYYADRMTGQRWYVSEKHGDDANDGKTPQTAVKTITGLTGKMRFPVKGTSILFERGGVYRGQTNVTPGMIYGAYGEGEKPVLTGSLKNYADPSLWEKTDVENVYVLKEKLTNVGIICFDHGLYDYGNYDALYGKNRIYGKNISKYSSLLEDLEFYCDVDTLYVRSDGGNPGERFQSIEIGNTVRIFDGAAADGVVFDNLSMRNTGTHAIGLRSCTNITVTNCVFSWLGGSLLGKHGETTTQYGNAIENYGNSDGFYVNNNWMYQIYDTAVTHQGSDSAMENIEYSENLMEYCHWGIECWQTGENTCRQKNYRSRYNLLRNGGYGWGSIVTDRQELARLYSFSKVNGKNEDMLCEYTIIDRCSGFLIDVDANSKEKFSHNIYVQDEDKTVGGLKGDGASACRDSAYQIKKKLGDEDCVFVLIPRK